MDGSPVWGRGGLLAYPFADRQHGWEHGACCYRRSRTTSPQPFVQVAGEAATAVHRWADFSAQKGPDGLGFESELCAASLGNLSHLPEPHFAHLQSALSSDLPSRSLWDFVRRPCAAVEGTLCPHGLRWGLTLALVSELISVSNSLLETAGGGGRCPSPGRPPHSACPGVQVAHSGRRAGGRGTASYVSCALCTSLCPGCLPSQFVLTESLLSGCRLRATVTSTLIVLLSCRVRPCVLGWDAGAFGGSGRGRRSIHLGARPVRGTHGEVEADLGVQRVRGVQISGKALVRTSCT